MKKAYRINVDNLVYAVLEKDKYDSVEYGEIKKFAEAMQIQLTPTVATGELYGDGEKQSVVSKLTGITAVLDVTKVNIDVRSEIMGNEYEDGVVTEKGTDLAPYIAIGYRVPQDEPGVAEYVWLLKGKAQPYAGTIQQATESINYSTDSITVEFVPRDFDGAIRKFADSADSDFTEEQANKWFENVPGEISA